ncbi:MAG: glycosyltransferase family 39 protein [Saprospiraceae bacterium]|nr:glycosyltransferase family 39 protein [Saprospiraceae bacterium]
MRSILTTLRPYWPYLLLWFGLNILQSLTTELLHDEAYYWVYANHLDWGYFDHPPAVAVLIRAGLWLPGELGVRLTTVLVSTGVLAFLFAWIKPRRPGLFFLFVASMMLFHIGGFVAVPDIPLLALTCGFLYLFQRYLREDSLGTALLLALICALLMYSKYHAAILLVFAIVPNLGALMRRRTFWLIPLVALVLFAPHLWWQWQHDFVTFRFHLFERGSRGFRWDYPLNYVLGQLLVYGPLMGFLVLASIRHWQIRDRFARTLAWVVMGVFGLFLLMSLRGRIEANWTALAFPALVWLSYPVIEGQDRLLRWLKILAIPSVVLIVIVRILFAVEVVTDSKFRETHGWKAWAASIQDAADGSTAIFRNSYQQAAKYMFYSGEPSFSMNGPNYRGNQFDLLPDLEVVLQGAPVTVFTSSFHDSLAVRFGDALDTGIETYHRQRFDAFNSFNQLEIRLVQVPETVRMGTTSSWRLEVLNPLDLPVVVPDQDVTRIMLWMRHTGERSESWQDLGPPGFERLEPGASHQREVQVVAPDPPGTYAFRLGVMWNLTGGKNTFLHHIEVVR